MEKEIISKSEACIFLGISRATLDRYIKRRQIPYIKMGLNNSKVLFKRSDLLVWLDIKKSCVD